MEPCEVCGASTDLYCYVHQTPCCFTCANTTAHATCVVKPAGSMKEDDVEWPMMCPLCSKPVMNAGDCVRNPCCLEVLHKSCNDANIGYAVASGAADDNSGVSCPMCKEKIPVPEEPRDDEVDRSIVETPMPNKKLSSQNGTGGLLSYITPVFNYFSPQESTIAQERQPGQPLSLEDLISTVQEEVQKEISGDSNGKSTFRVISRDWEEGVSIIPDTPTPSISVAFAPKVEFRSLQESFHTRENVPIHHASAVIENPAASVEIVSNSTLAASIKTETSTSDREKEISEETSFLFLQEKMKYETEISTLKQILENKDLETDEMISSITNQCQNDILSLQSKLEKAEEAIATWKIQFEMSEQRNVDSQTKFLELDKSALEFTDLKLKYDELESKYHVMEEEMKLELEAVLEELTTTKADKTHVEVENLELNNWKQFQLKRESERSNSMIEINNVEIQKLKDELQKSLQENSVLLESVQALQVQFDDRVSSLEDSRKNLIEELDHLQESSSVEITRLNNLLRDRDSEMTNYQSESEALKVELIKLNSDLQISVEREHVLTEKNIRASEEIAAMNSSREVATSSRVENLMAEVAKLTDDLNFSRSEVTNLSAELLSRSESTDCLNEKVFYTESLLEELRVKNNLYLEELSTAKSLISNLSNDNSNFSMDLLAKKQEAENYALQISNLQMVIQDRESEVSALNDNFTALQSQNLFMVEQVNEKSKLSDSYKQTLDDLSGEFSNLQLRFEELQGEKVRLEGEARNFNNSDFESKILGLKNENEILVSEKLKIEGELCNVKEELLNLKNSSSIIPKDPAVDELQAKLKKFAVAIKTTRTECDNLKAENIALVSNSAALQEEVSLLKNNLFRLEGELEVKGNALEDALKSKINLDKKSSKSKNSRTLQSEDDFFSNFGENFEEGDSTGASSEQVIVLQTNLDEITTKFSNLSSEFSKVMDNFELSQQENEILRAEISNHVSETEYLKPLVVSKDKVLENLKTDIEKLNEQILMKDSVIASLKAVSKASNGNIVAKPAVKSSKVVTDDDFFNDFSAAEEDNFFNDFKENDNEIPAQSDAALRSTSTDDNFDALILMKRKITIYEMKENQLHESLKSISSNYQEQMSELVAKQRHKLLTLELREKSANAEIDALNKELVDLRLRIQNTSNKTENGDVDALSKISKDHSEILEDNARLVAEIESLTAENKNSLQILHDELQSTKLELRKCEHDREEDGDSFTLQLNSIEADHKLKIQAFESKLQLLEDEYSRSCELIRGLELSEVNLNEKLNSQIAVSTELQENLVKLREELEDKIREVKIVTAELEKAKLLELDLAAQLSSKNKMMEDFSNELEAASALEQELRDKIETLLSQVGDLQNSETVSRLELKVHELENVKNQLQEDIASKCNEIEILKRAPVRNNSLHELQTPAKERSSLPQIKGLLENSPSTSPKETVRKLPSDESAVKSKGQMLLDKYKQLAESHKNLKASIVEKEAELTQCVSQINKLEFENEKIRSEVASESALLNSLVEVLQKFKSCDITSNDFDNELPSSCSAIIHLIGDKLDLTLKELSDITAMNSDLNAELASVFRKQAETKESGEHTVRSDVFIALLKCFNPNKASNDWIDDFDFSEDLYGSNTVPELIELLREKILSSCDQVRQSGNLLDELNLLKDQNRQLVLDLNNSKSDHSLLTSIKSILRNFPIESNSDDFFDDFDTNGSVNVHEIIEVLRTKIDGMAATIDFLEKEKSNFLELVEKCRIDIETRNNEIKILSARSQLNDDTQTLKSEISRREITLNQRDEEISSLHLSIAQLKSDLQQHVATINSLQFQLNQNSGCDSSSLSEKLKESEAKYQELFAAQDKMVEEAVELDNINNELKKEILQLKAVSNSQLHQKSDTHSSLVAELTSKVKDFEAKYLDLDADHRTLVVNAKKLEDINEELRNEISQIKVASNSATNFDIVPQGEDELSRLNSEILALENENSLLLETISNKEVAIENLRSQLDASNSFNKEDEESTRALDAIITSKSQRVDELNSDLDNIKRSFENFKIESKNQYEVLKLECDQLKSLTLSTSSGDLVEHNDAQLKSKYEEISKKYDSVKTAYSKLQSVCVSMKSVFESSEKRLFSLIRNLESGDASFRQQVAVKEKEFTDRISELEALVPVKKNSFLSSLFGKKSTDGMKWNPNKGQWISESLPETPGSNEDSTDLPPPRPTYVHIPELVSVFEQYKDEWIINSDTERSEIVEPIIEVKLKPFSTPVPSPPPSRISKVPDSINKRYAAVAEISKVISANSSPVAPLVPIISSTSASSPPKKPNVFLPKKLPLVDEAPNLDASTTDSAKIVELSVTAQPIVSSVPNTPASVPVSPAVGVLPPPKKLNILQPKKLNPSSFLNTPINKNPVTTTPVGAEIDFQNTNLPPANLDCSMPEITSKTTLIESSLDVSSNLSESNAIRSKSDSRNLEPSLPPPRKLNVQIPKKPVALTPAVLNAPVRTSASETDIEHPSNSAMPNVVPAVKNSNVPKLSLTLTPGNIPRAIVPPVGSANKDDCHAPTLGTIIESSNGLLKHLRGFSSWISSVSSENSLMDKTSWVAEFKQISDVLSCISQENENIMVFLNGKIASKSSTKLDDIILERDNLLIQIENLQRSLNDMNDFKLVPSVNNSVDAIPDINDKLSTILNRMEQMEVKLASKPELSVLNQSDDIESDDKDIRCRLTCIFRVSFMALVVTVVSNLFVFPVSYDDKDL